jgi:pilus assembly protein Flp/PilA
MTFSRSEHTGKHDRENRRMRNPSEFQVDAPAILSNHQVLGIFPRLLMADGAPFALALVNPRWIRVGSVFRTPRMFVSFHNRSPSMRNLFLVAKSLFTRKEEGATMVEYGLMVALIAVVCLAAVTALGLAVRGTFTGITAAL